MGGSGCPDGDGVESSGVNVSAVIVQHGPLISKLQRLCCVVVAEVLRAVVWREHDVVLVDTSLVVNGADSRFVDVSEILKYKTMRCSHVISAVGLHDKSAAVRVTATG